MSFNIGDYVKFNSGTVIGTIYAVLSDNYYQVKYLYQPHEYHIVECNIDHLISFIPSFKLRDIVFHKKKLWSIMKYYTNVGGTNFGYILQLCKNPSSCACVEDLNQMRLLVSRDDIEEQSTSNIMIYINILEKTTEKLSDRLNDQIEEFEGEMFRQTMRLQGIIKSTEDQNKKMKEQIDSNRDYNDFLKWLPKDKQKEFESLYFQYALTPK